MNHAGTSRKGIQLSVPAPISKRVRCSVCRRIQSIGQYAIGETVCLTCRPKPAGWRRGDLQTVQFKEVA